MKFDPDKHPRRTIRLKEYDYAQLGGYFIPIVMYQRDLLFGKIADEEMQLSDFDKIADECWAAIPEHFLHVELGAYVIMPNHVHGIVVINENGTAPNSSPSVGARQSAPKGYASPLPPRGVKPKSIGAIVGSFKSAVTKRIGRKHNATGIWQRNYGACPDWQSRVEGSTSFAARKIGIESIGISNQTRPCGRKMKKIH